MTGEIILEKMSGMANIINAFCTDTVFKGRCLRCQEFQKNFGVATHYYAHFNPLYENIRHFKRSIRVGGMRPQMSRRYRSQKNDALEFFARTKYPIKGIF